MCKVKHTHTHTHTHILAGKNSGGQTTNIDVKRKKKETSRRCLDNVLITGMFTPLVCTTGKRKPEYKIGVPDTDTADREKRKTASNQARCMDGWVSRDSYLFLVSRETFVAGKINKRRRLGVTRSVSGEENM